MISAVKSGFCLAAPRDQRLLGELDAFLKSGAMPSNIIDGHEMTDWNVAMVRMGKPVSTVEKPASMSGTTSNYQRNHQNKVDHWTPDRC